MDAGEYQGFTERLLARLAAEPEVVGVVALGSMSGVPPLPDRFSDHDFFVVVPEGAQERFRGDLSWLPDAAALVLTFRETAHGLKALWASGHLAEFAVFSPEQLPLARVNRYRVLLDRADVAERMARVREASAAQALASPDEAWSAGQLLGCLVVGAGRWARGERLSGHQLVRCQAVGHLLSLLKGQVAPASAALLDGLDPWRRLERALPELAAELEGALTLPAPAAARSLLALLVRLRPGLLTEAARAAVGRALDEADGARAPSGQPPSTVPRPQDGG